MMFDNVSNILSNMPKIHEGQIDTQIDRYCVSQYPRSKHTYMCTGSKECVAGGF